MNRRKPEQDVSQLTLPMFVRYEPVLVPQGNGEFLVKPGRPIVVNGTEEVSTAEFARLTGLSQRHITTLCDEGRIVARKRSPLPKSEWLIRASEVSRFRTITESEPKPE